MQGKVVFLTGASSGIGEAIAKRLGQEKAKVAIAARRIERLQQVKADIEKSGGECLCCKCDVSDRDQVRKSIQDTVDKFGDIDVIINNAGVLHLSHWKNVEKHELEFYSMIDVNIKGPLYVISAVVPSMISRKSGHIVNISSSYSRVVIPTGSIYCATKSAMEAYTKGLRLELAEHGIKVTSIQPGYTTTEIASGINDEDVKAGNADFVNSMKFLDPDDVADTVIYSLKLPEHAAVSELLICPKSQNQ